MKQLLTSFPLTTWMVPVIGVDWVFKLPTHWYGLNKPYVNNLGDRL